MTLSPQDQMAGEYEQWAIDWKRDSLQPEYVVKKMAKADGEIKELLSNIDAMIVDRDDAYTKREQFRKLWSEAECDGDNLRVEVDRLREAEALVRRYLWLTHGHFATIYGDDGEMQCCHEDHGILDFKRDPIGKILDRITPQPADPLTSLADALVENVINTPDDEILKEVEEDHGDPEHEANIMRKIIDDAADTPNEETLKAIAEEPEPETYETADALMRDMMEDTPQPAEPKEKP